jgi:tight adherence protein B
VPHTDVAGRLRARVQQEVGRRRRDERERARAVEACAVLAAELRSGRSAAPALEAAAEVAYGATAQALRAAASAAALGGDVPVALTGPAPTSAVPELLRGLAACWTVCAATGSGLAAAVERLGEAQRAAAEQRRAVEVELAGPRVTARLLALLPVVGLVLAAGLGAAPLDFLLGTLPGRVCLLLGLVLEVVGLRWTGRLAARAAGG